MPCKPKPPDPHLKAEIIRLRSEGVQWKQIERDYNVPRSTAWYWLHYEEIKTFNERLKHFKNDQSNSNIKGTAA